MSLTSDEVNFLVYRYLLEAGKCLGGQAVWGAWVKRQPGQRAAAARRLAKGGRGHPQCKEHWQLTSPPLHLPCLPRRRLHACGLCVWVRGQRGQGGDQRQGGARRRPRLLHSKGALLSAAPCSARQRWAAREWSAGRSGCAGRGLGNHAAGGSSSWLKISGTRMDLLNSQPSTMDHSNPPCPAPAPPRPP